MEHPRTLYDAISDLTAVRRLISDREQEGIYLEFKTKKDSRIGDLSESDAFQFSRALSGFANSDGGVLVWGVETDKDERARSLKPITGVVEFAKRLKKSMLNAVQPMVDEIEMAVILEDQIAEPPTGYLKILIPRSDKTPHRALLAGREYYRRSTEGFYRLEHFDLEDAFGRRPRPALAMQISLTSRPGDDPDEEVTFSFLNEGRGPAKHPAFTCNFSSDVLVVATTPRIGDNSLINGGAPIVSHQEDHAVIHAVPIASLIGKVRIRRISKGTSLHLKVSWYAEGMRMRTWEGDVANDSSLRDHGTPG